MTDSPAPQTSLSVLAGRSAIGGVLMGLANLVPGISGGTMLLAAGVYPRFISAIADVTTLRFRRESLVVLASVVAAAGLAIVLFAGIVKDLVVEHRWMAYSLFIGLTLGGVPLVRRLIRRFTPGVIVSALVGLAVMIALALSQGGSSTGAAAGGGGFMLMLFAGIAGASAMILPGISGGYLLLVLGVYVTILSAIDAVKEALRAGDLSLMMTPMMDVVLPVGIGVVIGVVAVSNGLKWLLARFEQPTLGVLLGLLVGAVAGLWPFQRPIPPALGDTIKGKVVTAQMLAELEPKDFPTEFFDPSLGQIGGAIAFVVLGLVLTGLVARIGQRRGANSDGDL